MKPIKDLKDEIKDCLILFLAMLISVAVIIVYQDALPLWVIILFGFWYPLGLTIKALYKAIFKPGDL